jgi:PleD family two-component response regulator
LIAALCVLTVMRAILLNRELARRSAAERKLTVLATTDGLTGLANRRHFNRTFASDIYAESARGGLGEGSAAARFAPEPIQQGR